MSDKKQEQQQQHCPRSEQTKNNATKSDCVDDRMVFPDEKLKPAGLDSRNFANSNTNPGYGTDANGEVVEEFK